MSFYALVLNGVVLGFRDNVDESSLGLAEKTALVAWAGEPISIYEISGHMPDDAGRERHRVEAFLRANPETEAASVVRAVETADESEPEEFDGLNPSDVTGCYRRVDGEPGSSGFFQSVG